MEVLWNAMRKPQPTNAVMATSIATAREMLQRVDLYLATHESKRIQLVTLQKEYLQTISDIYLSDSDVGSFPSDLKSVLGQDMIISADSSIHSARKMETAAIYGCILNRLQLSNIAHFGLWSTAAVVRDNHEHLSPEFLTILAGAQRHTSLDCPLWQ